MRPVEELAGEEPGSYDAVVASEVVEHVADAHVFVKACCALVKVRYKITMLSYTMVLLRISQLLMITTNSWVSLWTF